MRRQVTKKTDLRNNRSFLSLETGAPGSGKRRTSKRLVAISRRLEGRRRWSDGADKAGAGSCRSLSVISYAKSAPLNGCPNEKPNTREKSEHANE
jgi:hypothetical protein